MTALIEAGRIAPAFELRDQSGRVRRLAEFAGAWVVLYFYPEDDTPVCTVQACDMNESMDHLEAMGVRVLAISPQGVESKAAFARKFALRFTLLSDEEDGKGRPKVCMKYGVYGEKKMYGRAVLGIRRCTYLIGPDGRVAKRFDNVRTKGHAVRVVRWLEKFGLPCRGGAG